MKYNFKLILLLQYCIQVIVSQDQCIQGCISCNAAESFQKQECLQSDQGYQLDKSNSLCIYQLCDENLYYQTNADPTKSQCLAICNDYYQANDIQNTCNLLNQCPQSFITSSDYSSNTSILNILSYQDNSYLVQYSNFLNYVNKTTGEIILRFNYDSNNLGVYTLNGNLFIILMDYSINLWEIEKNTYQKLCQIMFGKLSNNTLMYYVEEEYYYIVTYDFSKNTNYINLFNLQQEIKVIDLQLSNSYQKIFFFSQYIVIQDNTKIKLNQLILKQENIASFYLNEITPNFICNIITDQEIKNLIYSLNNKKYIFFQQNQQNFNIIDEEQQNCFEVKVGNQIMKIELVESQQSNDLLIIQLQTQIIIKAISDINNNLDQISLNGNPLILDVLINNINQQMFILTNQNQITCIQQQNQNGKFQYNVIKTLPVLIKNPQQLIYPSQSNQIQNIFFTIGKDFQQFYFSYSDIQVGYISKSFRQSYLSNKGLINKIIYENNQSLLYVCSQDGMLTVWNIITQFNAEYYKEYLFKNDSCRDFVQLQNTIAAVLLQYSIVIFDLNDQSKKTVLTQTDMQFIQQYSLSTNGQYILIHLDSCTKIIDINLNILVDKCIAQNIVNSEISSKQIIYIYGQQFINAYQIDLTNNDLILQSYSIQNCQNIVNFFLDESIPNQIQIIYFDSILQQLFVLDDKLNIQFQAQLNSISKFISIKPFIDLNQQTTLFLVYKTSVITQGNLYFIAAINEIGNQFTQIQNMTNSLGIYQVDNYLNYNGQLIFNMILASNNITDSLIFTIQWNAVQGTSNIEQLIVNTGDQFTFLTSSYNTQFIYTGSKSGFTGISSSTSKYANLIYQNPPNDTNNIQQVVQSYQLNRIFVVKKNIKEFDLILNTYIEDISFDDISQNQIEYVQGFKISNNLRLISCYKSQSFLVKSYNYTTPQVFKLNNFGIISNYYINEDQNIIFIYGTKLSIFNLALQNEFIIIPSNTQNNLIAQCIFPDGLIICKQGNYQLIFLNSLDFTIIKQFQVTGIELGFFLNFDQINNRFYIYKQTIQVYTILGQFIFSLDQLYQDIIEFNFYGNYIAVLTIGNGYIYDRVTQNYVSTFLSSQGGNIIKSIYIAQQNHLLFFSNYVTRGIQVFDLTNLKSKNPLFLSFNPSVQIVDFAYEESCQMLIIVNQMGNIEVFNYPLGLSYNFLPIDQFQNNKASGFSIDYLTNSLIVYNINLVVQLNYNLLTQKIYQIVQPIQYQYIIKTDQNNKHSFITDNIFFTADNQLIHYDFQNNLLLYNLTLSANQVVKSFQLVNDLIILGTSMGQIITYNLTKRASFILSLQYIQPVVNIQSISTQFWFSQKDGSINIFQIQNFSQFSLPSSSFNLQTVTKNQNQVQLNLIILDEQYNRYFVQFVKQKRCIVINMITNAILQNMSFPTDEISKIMITTQYVILYSTAQINVHRRDNLFFQQQIRCNNRLDQITDLKVLNDSVYLITFTNRIDIYFLIDNQNTIELVDSLSTQFPVIIYSNYDSSNTLLNFVGFSSTNIFEKKYWLASYTFSSQWCSSVVEGSTSVQFLKNLNDLKDSNINMQQQQLLYLNLFDFTPINSINQQLTSMILQSFDQKSAFDINQQSFQSIQSDAYLKNFDLNFTEQGIYQFSNYTKNIYIQDLKIESQNILNVSISFSQKNLIVINNLILTNVSDNFPNKTQNSSNQNLDQDFQNFLDFQDCQKVIIYNLQIFQANIKNIQQFLIFSRINQIVLKNVTVKESNFEIMAFFENIQNINIENIYLTVFNKQPWKILQFKINLFLEYNQILRIKKQQQLIIWYQKIYLTQSKTKDLKVDFKMTISFIFLIVLKFIFTTQKLEIYTFKIQQLYCCLKKLIKFQLIT
ncbi:hypothetical protein TTHERM_000112899 (macronuclear) [Tetrahymena thermophila SB210]|uniref:Transmembrane protein n=1 Tax=Tetrahymena thermophila (strain SB210) TaxID=312017 RepID=W7XFW8_TETTS|nr:hypothetical protein TTHERM_000112899 [Tetrahymena thermophila SB210]EWS75773.1 hypothetical protein TTHERM_000112899 [Tetrahymena thermophila SB210]|eukprot:XP_012651695.1 hypothetical protein TTHERM_000112899 [Tetrahymena thermophila SB210]